MTAILGLVAKDGIVMAGDSQLSDMNTGAKTLDSRKLFLVKFRNGPAALVARAGSMEGSDLFQEQFEVLAEKTEVTEPRTIANVAERALIDVRAKVLQQASHPKLSKKVAQEEFKALSHVFVLGYVFGGRSYLYTADSNSATARKSVHTYVTLGTGQTTARFILDGMDTLSMDREQALGLAAYTVAMCKRADCNCEGPIQLGWISASGVAEILPEDVRGMMQKAAETSYRNICKRLADEVSWNFSREFFPYDQARRQTEIETLEAKLRDLQRQKERLSGQAKRRKPAQ